MKLSTLQNIVACLKGLAVGLTIILFCAFAGLEIGGIGFGNTLPSTHTSTSYKVFYEMDAAKLWWYNGSAWVDFAPVASPTFTGTVTAPALVMTGRVQGKQGSDVASANDMTLGTGNFFYVTGTTTINAIAFSGWQAGSQITLKFQGACTVKNNTAGGVGFGAMLLQSSTDFTTTANDMLTLQWDGSNWNEITRSLN